MKRIVILSLSICIFLPIHTLRAETTIESLAKKIVHQRDSNDTRVYKIEKWVMKNIRYRSDQKQFNMNDRWTLPMETLQRKRESGLTHRGISPILFTKS